MTDLDTELLIMEDLQQAKKYHERALDERLKKPSAANVDNSSSHSRPCCCKLV